MTLDELKEMIEIINKWERELNVDLSQFLTTNGLWLKRNQMINTATANGVKFLHDLKELVGEAKSFLVLAKGNIEHVQEFGSEYLKETIDNGPSGSP